MGTDDLFVDIFVGLDGPVLPIFVRHGPEAIQGLMLQALDPGGIGNVDEIGGAEDRFGIAMGVRRMDRRFHHVVVHQTVDDVGAVAFGGAEDGGIPEQDLVADIGVGAASLTFPKIFEGMAGIEAIAGHLELLAVTGRVGLTGMAPVDFREIEASMRARMRSLAATRFSREKCQLTA